MICTTPYDDNRNRRFLCGGERHECEDGSTLCEVCDADEIAADELEVCPGCGLLVEFERHGASQIGGDGYGDRCAAVMDVPGWIECPVCDWSDTV